jgi:predicted CXXCH cytochrome family protein
MKSPLPTKQRAFRIDLDHYKRPDLFSLAKWLLSIAAAIASVGYAAYLFAPGSGGQSQLAPGNVALVHAAWENQCSECHQDFHAIRGDAWAAQGVNGVQAAEAKCLQCHAAPNHHNESLAPDKAHRVASCGSCHQEHRGSDASLVRMDDQNCTRCHANLSEMIGKSARQPAVRPVTSFYSSRSAGEPDQWPHPEFRSLTSDPGTIAFNHALHMTAGMPASVEARALSKYEQIADKEFLRRAIPGWTEDKQGDVQLACSSCHEPATSDDRLAFAPGTSSDEPDSPKQRTTAHMALIRFDRHCQACHQLNVGPQATEVVPHGLKARELEQVVRALVGQTERREEKKETPTDRIQSRLLGKSANDFLAEKLSGDAAARFQAMREHLGNTTCRKCHSFPSPGDAFTTDVLPPNLPQFWFHHARFDHAAHRAADCLQCHARAMDSRKASDVVIAGYQNCIECHRPNGTPSPSQDTTSSSIASFVGARSDCVECHTYHGAELTTASDHPRLRDFLSGPQP